MRRHYMLFKLRRMRRLLKKIETLRLDVWDAGLDSERFAERCVSGRMENLRSMVRAIDAVLLDSIDSLNLDASGESWPRIRVEFDPVTYRDPESGARFLVATISTTACPVAPNARDVLVSSRREACPIDGREERTSTIANALSAPVSDLSGDRK